MNSTERQRLHLALVIVGLMLAVFGGMWLGMAHNQSKASECSAPDGGATPVVVEGVLTKHEKYQRFYVSSNGQEWPVYRCRRGGCPHYKQLMEMLGQQAIATFCEHEFLTLDVQHQRIVTRDVSSTPTILAGLAFSVGLILVVVLLAFGDRKLSIFKRERSNSP